jgi:hypothetical protein
MSYRSSVTIKLAGYIAVLFLIILGMGISLLSGGYPVSHTTLGKILGVIAILYGLCGVMWAIVRVGRMGVVATDQGVLLRNWIRSTRVSWSEVARFEFGDQLKNRSLTESLRTPELQTYAVMKNGNHVALAGLTITRLKPRQSREKVQRLLDALNAEVAAHLGGPEAG